VENIDYAGFSTHAVLTYLVNGECKFEDMDTGKPIIKVEKVDYDSSATASADEDTAQPNPMHLYTNRKLLDAVSNPMTKVSCILLFLNAVCLINIFTVKCYIVWFIVEYYKLKTQHLHYYIIKRYMYST